MNWTRPADLRAQLQRLWDRGELLASLVTGEPLFPKRLVLKCPTSAEMADRFDEVRAWIGELRDMPHCRMEMREFNHRVFGANAVPEEVWIDAVDNALALIHKHHEAARFAALLDVTRKREPRLLKWMAQQPLRAMEHSDEWSRLLDILVWIQDHPRPGVYLRQVDTPRVHSKFIEAHRGVLAELLDIVLPPEAIEPSASGVSQFAKRYGFLDKPLRIRFRILDPACALTSSVLHEQDITLDAKSFIRLDPKVSRVFITENEINFLAFPKLTGSLVVFGGGYGFDVLAQTTWLSRCSVHYWGDIDTHGFAILDQLRAHVGHAESFLMDRATLLAFEAQWGEEEKQTRRDLLRLNSAECSLYNDLRDNRLRMNLRLEQERIGFGWVESALSSMR